MAPMRMRGKQPCYLLVGLVFISIFLYSSYSPPVHYIERQDLGQNITRTATQYLPETGAQPNAEKVVSSTEWEETPLTLGSAAVVPSSSLLPSANSENTVSTHDAETPKQGKAAPNTVEEVVPAVATSAREQWETKPVKKDPPPSVPVVHSNGTDEMPSMTTPMARGVITSSLYDAGFDTASTQLCEDAGSGMQLLVLVTSAPRHADARMAIRQTWGHYGVRRDMSIGFLVANPKDNETVRQLEAESALYSDIIRAKFVDSYVNLTLKTISMFEWVDTYCPKVHFVLKTDDDMFINVPRLLSFINKHSGDKRTIYGRLAKKWKPIRNKKSKYYVSPQQYKPAVFPDFTTGPAYLLTSDTIHDLYVTTLNRTYLHLEDVYTTGIVAQDLKIKRVHANEFMNRRILFHACNIQKGISIHMVKYPEQFDLWKKLLDGRAKCK
ncbi:beta-1,3-galactosyltransferase 5-like [Ischnura elegans]|uniref:beta-1,3-galactosyltransferase 5-like n=1 Tax=Ischnura elegans TaxID=197161 RepID=UPI001ED86B92|nr:beta-1,3-galactosyltransferase 5-like [Ischnura elegans]XP_046405933.1 beta-1,3-galactosyltransferase 5-like [Ischnura elegans]XP_046405934.1 beta-1,3-galactosyltransferase 5-like [Ischnura elegans]XP_046405935.1 beta-1,3-galactosyltransferase 5-like [Ischnura elegans]XP_046405936.1 beta-1,3-galactosyltransferase 5-like [Ischnura elegans]XP_046405937.1 beta-1,3-galactosyltransferase 5-like [Ischnura elegans]